MVISNLNIARILELVRFIEACLVGLRPYSKLTKEKFLSDRKNPPFVESYLRRGLEAVFDIGRHILAKIAGFKEIEYKAIVRELEKKEVIGDFERFNKEIVAFIKAYEKRAQKISKLEVRNW